MPVGYVDLRQQSPGENTLGVMAGAGGGTSLSGPAAGGAFGFEHAVTEGTSVNVGLGAAAELATAPDAAALIPARFGLRHRFSDRLAFGGGVTMGAAASSFGGFGIDSLAADFELLTAAHHQRFSVMGGFRPSASFALTRGSLIASFYPLLEVTPAVHLGPRVTLWANTTVGPAIYVFQAAITRGTVETSFASVFAGALGVSVHLPKRR